MNSDPVLDVLRRNVLKTLSLRPQWITCSPGLADLLAVSDVSNRVQGIGYRV